MKTSLKLLSLILVGMCFLLNSDLYAQNSGEEILFQVENTEVPVSEFTYIYDKNSAGQSTYDEESIKEYLDLYKRFKLKVHHARQLKMDTIQRLVKELAGYREQLATTYLNDNSVMNRLSKEAYDRMQREAEISHILIRLPKHPGADTALLYERAMNIYEKIKAGDSKFEEAAKVYSQDEKNRNEGGYIGFVRAILPKGYYQLESTIYNLEVGEISKPARSPRGYHIVKLLNWREAKPEYDVAHILIRKKEGSTDHSATRRRAEDVHNRLTRGVPFEEMAAKESDDDQTTNKGGRIGFVKPSDYDEEFEQAIYGLTEDGQVSGIVETRIGFHIIKRLGINELGEFKDAKRKIENQLRRTEREELAQEAMLSRIKREEGMTVNEISKNKMIQSIDESVFSYRWKAPDVDDDVIITFNDGSIYNAQNFIQYLAKNPKERVQERRLGLKPAMLKMFDEWVREICFNKEKAQLEEKYPDFAALMREYEEGILLFEITKENVWDKASTDSIGLMNFFKNNRENYLNPAKIKVTSYTLMDVNAKQAKKLSKKIKKYTSDEMFEKYKDIPQEDREIEITDSRANEYKWKENAISGPTPLPSSDNSFIVHKTKEYIPATQKSLDECRGYVIADYQEELEKSWVKELESQYEVTVNEKALNKLIQN